ncbi:cytochrome P450 family protein [Nocardiopsis potens]|uniref:cytochrome P450 n=1 Tax=Nocardiopsis potens TaxID=1246458 RepID=UPI000348147D|nr:cytochrome P450 [Nocardiopsis potens]
MTESLNADPRNGGAPRCPLRDGAVPLYEQAGSLDGPLWEELRSRFGRIAPVLLEPDLRAWLLLGYEENLHVLRDRSTYSRDTRRWNEIRDGRRVLGAELRPTMSYRSSALYADGAEHARLIAPIDDALSRLSDARIRAEATDVADRLIDDFCEHGRADLIGDYAMMLPAMLMNRFFGLEDAYGYVLGELSAGLWLDDGARAAESVAQMRNYFGGLVQRKRSAPGEDVTSWMMAPEFGMTDEEMADQLVLLVGAAHLPTSNLIGNVLRALLAEPATAREFASGALPLNDLVNHVIWTEPPLPMLAARFPTRDVVVGGTPVAEGEPLIIGFAPAHADPKLGRPGGAGGSALDSGGNSAHLMWGAGEHRCPARSLAERVVGIGVRRLLDRLPRLRAAVPADELAWAPALFSRGLVELPVLFDPVEAPQREAPAPPPAPAAPAAEERPDDLLTRLLRWWQGSGRSRRSAGD